MNKIQDVIENIAQLRAQARERYETIQVEIERLSQRLDQLKSDRDALAKELGIVASGGRERQARGLLPQACLNALMANPSGLTSAQVVEWIKRNEPEVKPGAAPAVLSRMRTKGEIRKSPTGYYSLK